MFRTLLLVIFVALLPTLGLARAAHAQPSEEPNRDARAEALFRDGRKAVVKKDWTGARKLLGQAYELKQTHDIAALLGQAEYELKRYRDAAEHIEYSLRHFPPTEDEEPRTRLRAWFDEAKQHVAAVRISVKPDGARVRIGDQDLGLAPLAAAAFVDPGSRVVTAELPGHRTASQTIEAKAGQEITVKLSLDPTSSAASASQPGTSEPMQNGGETSANERSIVPAAIAGGVAAVGLGLGVGFALSARGNASDADELADKVGKSGCETGTAAASDCAALKDKNETADSQSRLAVVGFSVFAVGAAVAITYLVWPSDQGNTASRARRTPSKVTLRPSVTFDSHWAAVGLRGAF